MEDSGVVKIWGPRVVDEALKRWVGAEDGEEGVVVDEEWLWLGRLGWQHGLSVKLMVRKRFLNDNKKELCIRSEHGAGRTAIVLRSGG